MNDGLPEFVEPMLAKLARQAFDSEEHWFEIKWDGIRALTFIEGGAHRLIGRRRSDFTDRYPELAFLASLEPGLVLDGELVALRDGRPSFEAILTREQARGERRVAQAARSVPATYVVFDVLHRHFDPVMDLPLRERREHLAEVVDAAGDPRLVLSDGILGEGRAFFEQLAAQGLEGMVAKRLESRYLPARRTDEWTKIKTVQRVHCAIVGYDLDDEGDLKSVIVASDFDGELRCVGKVASGMTVPLRARLLERLRERPCETPLVECEMPGLWVEPGLYCTVGYLERTSAGNLRAPVFHGLVEEGE